MLLTGHEFKGEGQQPVACEGSQPGTIDNMIGWFAPAQIIIIHTGQIVVNQGIRVYTFESTGQIQIGLCVFPQDLQHGQKKDRTQPLAASQKAVIHGFV